MKGNLSMLIGKGSLEIYMVTNIQVCCLLWITYHDHISFDFLSKNGYTTICKEGFRLDCVMVFKHVKNPQVKLIKREFEALKIGRINRKQGDTVIMNKNDYVDKTKEHIPLSGLLIENPHS